MKKLVILLSILFTTFLFGQTATVPAIGDGSSSNPYQISTLNNLYWLAYQVDSNSVTFSGKYFIQTSDIDASSTSTWFSGQGWLPIGNETTQFSGNYDGQNHVVSGLYINNNLLNDAGFFGYAKDGKISNLSVTNVNVTAHSNCGGLIGKNNAAVNNCFTSGTLACWQWVGGLIGSNYYCNYTVNNSYSTCNVSGAATCGGFIGEVYSTSADSIINCYSTGNATRLSGWSSTDFGGFIGYDVNTIIKNCFSTGSISYTGSTNPTDKGFVGTDGGSTYIYDFFDQTSSAQNTDFAATGEPTSLMQTQSTFTGWDFSNTWAMDSHVNDGSPYLKWQYPYGYISTDSITFNSTSDLTGYFNSTNPVFTNIDTGGLNNSGSVHISMNANDLWTTKTGITTGPTGSVYTVSAFFFNDYNAGYGGLGFAASNSNAISNTGVCNPDAGLGMYTHAGGGGFENNDVDSNRTYHSDLLLQDKWYKVIFTATSRGSNTFDLDYRIWNSDSSGNVGSLVIEETLNGVVNSDLGGASTIYAYFCANGDRLRNIDNFYFNGGSEQNYALQFDGSSDFVSVPASSIWNFRTGDFTVEWWQYETDNSLYTRIFDIGSTKFGISNESGNIYLWINGNYTCSFPVTSYKNAWNHFTITRSGGTAYCYMNGSLIDSGSCTGDVKDSTDVMHIGNEASDGGTYFGGKLDELRFWNVALTQTEIQSSMNKELSGNETGLAAYYKFNNNNGTTVINSASTGAELNGTLNNFSSPACWVPVSYGLQAMPVELTTFTAAEAGNKVELKWNTATEINNYGFEIERSAVDRNKSAESWSDIGFVRGSGNSNSPKSYSYTDANPLSGSAEYRLKQIDNDGTVKYSSVLTVNSKPVTFELAQNYPNPFNPTTTIKFSCPVNSYAVLDVYNIIGQKVATLLNGEISAGIHSVVFNAENLASGVYIYKIYIKGGSQEFIQMKKLVLMK